MATTLTSATKVCWACGEPLDAKGDCVACILRTALEESAVENKQLPSLVFGDFEVEQRPDGFYWELGHGAMGTTYLAADKVLRRRVALKVIEVPAVATSRDAQAIRQRFLREARAAAALRHPNVAAVYHFGASPDGTHFYYAMELVEGETLETLVQRDGPLDSKVALEIAIQMAQALMAAAAHGLVHRDLKPGNIMLTRGGTDTAESQVKIIDFGLAKAIADAGGEPDLTHGQFGATLWFALTGLAPHSGTSIQEIRDRQAHDHLPVARLVARKVPEPMVKLLRSTLAIDPGKRPASARELMEALESCRRKLNHRIGVAGRRLRDGAWIYVVLLAALLSIGSFFLARHTASRKQTESAAKQRGAELLPQSIAVLPFDNQNHDPNADYLADGIPESIIHSLSQLPQLRVMAHSTVFQYKGKEIDPRKVGHDLGVQTVLMGRLLQQGDNLTIRTELVNVSDGTELWGQQYNYKVADVFAVQEEIAREISEKLRLKLSGSERQQLAKRPTENLKAFQYYMQGRSFAQRRTREDLLTAISYYDRAIEEDRNYALAYAGFADAYANLGAYGYIAP